MDNNWHSLSNEQITKILEIKKTGLSEKEVEERRLKHGRNVLPKEKEPTLFESFFKQFKSPALIILIVVACLSAFIGEHITASFITVIILLNAILGTFGEYKMIRSTKSIEKILKIKAKVVRDRKHITIDASELVVRRYCYIRRRKHRPCGYKTS